MRRELIVLGLSGALCVLAVGTGVSTVLAQAGPLSPGPTAISLLNPLCTSGSTNCQNGTVEGLIQSIVHWLWIIATPIAVGMIIIGALQMVTAAGNEEKFATGKRTVLYAVIGYAIILIGWGITSIIQSLLSQ